MEVQITLTIKSDAPSSEVVAKAIHKVVDDFVTSKKGLVTSFRTVEIRPGSEVTIAFPDA